LLHFVSQKDAAAIRAKVQPDVFTFAEKSKPNGFPKPVRFFINESETSKQNGRREIQLLSFLMCN